MRVIALALAVCFVTWAGSLAGSSAEEGAGKRWVGILPDPAQTDWGKPESWPALFVCRVLDQATGKAIPGARLIRTPEWISPWRLRHDAVLSTGAADADGIAHVPTESHAWVGECHWLVTAPGYASAHEYGKVPSPEVWLEQGVPFNGRVLDAAGRPVCAAVVETLGGCSHGTASARATTDAQGAFRIPRVPSGLPGQIWVEGIGIEADLFALDTPESLGRAGVLLCLEPGLTYLGRVVDLLGKPMPGVVVRAYNEQRGPTAMTGADGCFTLHGVESDADLLFFAPADLQEDEANRRVSDAVPGVPMQVVLTPTRVVEEDESVRILVRVRDAQGAPVRGLALRAVGVSTGRGPDGYTADEDSKDPDDPPPGTAVLEAVPGEYRLVPSEPFDPYTFDEVRVLAVAGETASVELRVRRQPRLRIEGGLPEEADLYLVLAGSVIRSWEIDTAWSPTLPAEGDATLRVELEGRPPYFFPVGPLQDGVRRVRVSLPPLRRIELPEGVTHVRLLDGARSAYCTEPEEGVLHTDASGALTLRWTGSDDEDYEATVMVPDAPGSTAKVDVSVARTVVRDVVVVAIEGGAHGEEREVERVHAEPGEMVVIEREGWRTLRVVAPPQGTHRVHYGTATLRLQVQDDGEACDALALVAGEVYAAPKGLLEIRGLPAGPVRVVVGRRNVHGAGLEMELSLRAQTVQESLVTLPDE